jgi:hypothetical protein
MTSAYMSVKVRIFHKANFRAFFGFFDLGEWT